MSNVKEVSSGFKLGDIKALFSQLKKENIKKISSDFKRENFNFKEIWAIILLSVRRYYWQPDHKEAHKKVPTDNFITAAIWLGSWLFPLCIILCVAYPLTSLKMTLELLSYADGILMVLSVLLTQLFTIAILWLVFLPICICVTFNIGKLCRNLHYVESVWYQNTGVRPSEVTADRGVYGEYCATFAAVDNLKTNGVYGKVFNNVFVPARDGLFNEIDVITVSEMGIHVIEAKGITGLLEGDALRQKWDQNHKKERAKNPLFQNLSHCNYLVEYLYDQLPECPLKRKNMFFQMKNVALFSIYNITDKLDRTFEPNMDFFMGMADNYAKLRFPERQLTPQEVDMICALLEGISHYPAQQRKRMIQQRKMVLDTRKQARREQANEAPDALYSIVLLQHPDKDGTLHKDFFIRRRDEYFIRYLDSADNWYKAIPNGKILDTIEPETGNAEKIFYVYSRIMAAKK